MTHKIDLKRLKAILEKPHDERSFSNYIQLEIAARAYLESQRKPTLQSLCDQITPDNVPGDVWETITLQVTKDTGIEPLPDDVIKFRGDIYRRDPGLIIDKLKVIIRHMAFVYNCQKWAEEQIAVHETY